jgi:para-aminobenzoate synthetase/4-amino-4-deoxychorismate lyase
MSPQAGEDGSAWLEFREPIRILETDDPESVRVLLDEIEAATTSGLFAAGFVTYEAARAFDPALKTRPAGPLPLAWFGLFETVHRHRELPWPRNNPIGTLDWIPTVNQHEYQQCIYSIREAIEKGQSYQANYTHRLQTVFDADPWDLFATLVTAQPVPFGVYAELDRHVICSASPELFFSLSGTTISTRPMKGTSPRGYTSKEDRRLAQELYDSEKNRAENLMIVDMIRNDLGRIATAGSVRVESLFDLESYASVHQLTSTVTAHTTASLSDIFTALFPCASITGAPKVRTMELLADLERSHRGIYTGTLGFVTPDHEAQFNVAIRTVHIDRERELAEYGTGGGIVWESTAEEEYRECEAKARVLGLEERSFDLLETLLWEPGQGFFLLEEHLNRLKDSAAYFAYPIDVEAVRQDLFTSLTDAETRPRRVRILLDRYGKVRIEQFPLEAPSDSGWIVALADKAIDIHDRFLYHKTTARQVYDRARASAPDYDEVLLWSQAGRMTEATAANIVYRIGDQLFTPPVEDGLLAGTFREELLRGGTISQRSLDRRELLSVDEIWLVNSVRRWIRVDQIDVPRLGNFQTVWRNTPQKTP